MSILTEKTKGWYEDPESSVNLQFLKPAHFKSEQGLNVILIKSIERITSNFPDKKGNPQETNLFTFRQGEVEQTMEYGDGKKRLIRALTEANVQLNEIINIKCKEGESEYDLIWTVSEATEAVETPTTEEKKVEVPF